MNVVGLKKRVLLVGVFCLGCPQKPAQSKLTVKPPVAVRKAEPEPEPESKAAGEDASKAADARKLALEAARVVYFDFDRDSIRADGRRVLEALAPLLREDVGVKVEIAGHCDARGSEEYNLHLGERRARSVLRFLRRLGVGEEQLSTISFGETRPVDDGMGEEAFGRNRRVEVTGL